VIAIVKYNAGNVQSVLFALQRLGAEAVVTDDHAMLQTADKVIFPGVGHAAPAMDYLRERGIADVLVSLQQPVLGICLGLQLMCSGSEEGDTACLGIFGEEVKRFVPGNSGLKVPQTGWNSIYNLAGPLFSGIREGEYVYYVHSYYAASGPDTVATTDYIQPYSAALQKNNFYAVQFHPEKSGVPGEKILHNFIQLP